LIREMSFVQYHETDRAIVSPRRLNVKNVWIVKMDRTMMKTRTRGAMSIWVRTRMTNRRVLSADMYVSFV
jgi:hypothetical protein